MPTYGDLSTARCVAEWCLATRGMPAQPAFIGQRHADDVRKATSYPNARRRHWYNVRAAAAINHVRPFQVPREGLAIFAVACRTRIRA
jgi:hypothetical protein